LRKYANPFLSETDHTWTAAAKSKKRKQPDEPTAAGSQDSDDEIEQIVGGKVVPHRVRSYSVRLARMVTRVGE
jgi:hypothetical protein